MADRFHGKVAWVTGGASGIGAALCRALAARGAIVVVTDVAVEGARALADELPGAWAAPLDVRHATAWDALAARIVAKEGRVDLLFNNAGVGLAGAVEDLDPADWQRVIDVNIWGVVHGTRAVYQRMIDQGGGVIVNTASGAALAPRPGMAPYAMTKAAVLGLTTSMKAEAALHGVAVHAVCPGYIATDIMKSTTYKSLDAEGLQANIPLKPVSAERCAQVVLRGVARGRTIIPVSKVVWLEWWLNRLSPALGMWMSRYRAKKFRAHRSG